MSGFSHFLVTGGAGFIGSAVCRHLVEDVGAVVTNVDKLTYAGNLESLRSIANSPRYRFIQADICDAEAMEAAFDAAQPDAVIHLAAESHVDRSITGSRAFVETNVLGTFEVLEAARRYWSRLPKDRAEAFRVLHVSTDEVYGSLGADGHFTETTRYDPSSPYSASKAASDHLAHAWYRTYGLPVIVSNCSNNCGPFYFPWSISGWLCNRAVLASGRRGIASEPRPNVGLIAGSARAVDAPPSLPSGSQSIGDSREAPRPCPRHRRIDRIRRCLRADRRGCSCPGRSICPIRDSAELHA